MYWPAGQSWSCQRRVTFAEACFNALAGVALGKGTWLAVPVPVLVPVTMTAERRAHQGPASAVSLKDTIAVRTLAVRTQCAMAYVSYQPGDGSDKNEKKSGNGASDEHGSWEPREQASGHE